MGPVRVGLHTFVAMAVLAAGDPPAPVCSTGIQNRQAAITVREGGVSWTSAVAWPGSPAHAARARTDRLPCLRVLRGGGVASAAKKRQRERFEHERADAAGGHPGVSSAAVDTGCVESSITRKGQEGRIRSRGSTESRLSRKGEGRLSERDVQKAMKGSLSDKLELLVGQDASADPMGMRKLSKTQKAVVASVQSLQAAMQAGDKTEVATILDTVAERARKTYAPDIWAVPALATGGFATGQSGRQKELQRSTTAVAKSAVAFDGSGQTVKDIRRAGEALELPNPTDEVLGIDDLTELRLALAAANETREIPLSVTHTREIGRYAKTAIGDLSVPEDVAVKHWLTKKRERRAQVQVQEAARRESKILQFATYLWVMARVKAKTEGREWDATRAEARALARARYVYEVEPYKQQQLVVKAAEDRQLGLAEPTLVKPKRRRPFKLKARHGARKNLNRKSSVVKRAGHAGKTSRSRADKRGNRGFGSQRKKRSGLSGGKTGASRFKKRKG